MMWKVWNSVMKIILIIFIAKLLLWSLFMVVIFPCKILTLRCWRSVQLLFAETHLIEYIIYKGWVKVVATILYFWHGFIHKVKHSCTLIIVAPLIYRLFLNVWKASYTVSTSLFVDVPYWPPPIISRISSSLVLVPGPSQWFLNLVKRS